MPTGTTFNAIYLGNFADLEAPSGTTGAYSDVDASYANAEANAGVLLGSYDHQDMLIVEITGTATGGIAIDNEVYYNATVTYYDSGSDSFISASQIVSVFQSTFNLDGLDISEISLDSGSSKSQHRSGNELSRSCRSVI